MKQDGLIQVTAVFDSKDVEVLTSICNTKTMVMLHHSYFFLIAPQLFLFTAYFLVTPAPRNKPWMGS